MNNSENPVVREKRMSLFWHFWIRYRNSVWLGQRKEEEERDLWCMKIYILLHYFTAHKRKSKRRRNTALKKKKSVGKRASSIGSQQVDTLAGVAAQLLCKRWQGSLSGTLGPAVPSSRSPQGHHLPWLLGLATTTLAGATVWSHGAGEHGLLLMELQAHVWLPPWTFLPPLSWLQGSLSLLAAHVTTGRFALRHVGKMKLCLPAVAAATRRFCVGSLEVSFRASVLWAQPPRHGRMLQGMSSFSWHFTQLHEAQLLYLVASFAVFLAFLGKLLL